MFTIAAAPSHMMLVREIAIGGCERFVMVAMGGRCRGVTGVYNLSSAPAPITRIAGELFATCECVGSVIAILNSCDNNVSHLDRNNV